MTIFDDIRKDAEAGTKGPWRVGPVDDTRVEDALGNEVAQIDGDYNQPDLWPIMEANARRIARVPELERIALAAEAHIEWLKNEIKACEAAGDRAGVIAYSRALTHIRAAAEAKP